jgi:hypothetical protein
MKSKAFVHLLAVGGNLDDADDPWHGALCIRADEEAPI